MEKTLKKEAFPGFLAELREKGQVLGPTRRGGGTSTYSQAIFGPINRIEELQLGYRSLMVSPRKILFPDHQSLYEYAVAGDDILLGDAQETWDEDRIFLGLHPCDIAAVNRLDQLFLKDRYVDPYYQNRRDHSLIIGLTCSQPQDHCFCNVVGTGPDCDSGCDLLLTDLGDRYYLRVLSDRGRRLLAGGAFEDAGAEDKKRREEALERVARALPPKLDLDRVAAAMRDKFGDALWDEFSDACVSCGACNMVCPTCHCFTILDKSNPDRSRGRRVLVWDACHFERFAQMAG
ncbi:MAG: 4Fe-4S dicluster domain-containing protein, partial [Thermodesulfobacteriota bacterium]